MRVIKFSSESRNYPIVTAKPCLFEDWIIHLLTFFLPRNYANSYYLFHDFGI